MGKTVLCVLAGVARPHQRDRRIDDHVCLRPDTFDDLGISFPIIVLPSRGGVIGMNVNDGRTGGGGGQAIGNNFCHCHRNARLPLPAPRAVQRGFNPDLAHAPLHPKIVIN